MLRRLGDDAYARVLAAHHEIVRAELEEHHGKEEGTQGDAFFASFTSPRAALAAAVAIQRALLAHDWIEGERPKVRMGLHTGEAAEASTGLVGYEVHRAARVAAVGYGGQILLSSAAAGLVEDALPSDESLRNLGAHRLKDLGRPEVIFQLEAEGLEGDFPPLRSLDNPELPNNLPASLSPFVGRATELAEVRELVLQSRLVTLTGAGGSGKTRLALQAAAELLDGSGEGVWLVELAPVNDPDLVPAAVMEALQIRQGPGTSPRDVLVAALRDQHVLVVVDNCEHVIDAVAKLVDQIGRNCPRVRIVATSREPLGVGGEQVYRVRSLSLPPESVESVEDLEGSDAIALFLAQARLRDSSFELSDDDAVHVASICRRLDGIPLAIELAAARLSSLSLVDLNRRLDQRFRLLTGGSRNALPRQQTLGATVAWSYDLLNEPERDVLRRLSVFVNGFDLDGVEAVCAHGSVEAFDVADIVGSLVNKNLVIAEHAAGTFRYRLLETIRQYSADQLVQVDGEEAVAGLRRLHAEFYLRLVEEAAPSLRAGTDQIAWLARLEREWDNLQAALAHFAADPDGVSKVLRLAVAGRNFFVTLLHFEPTSYLRDALARDDQVTTALRARALTALALLMATIPTDLQSGHSHLDVVSQLLEEARALAQELDDKALEAEVLAFLSANVSDVGDNARALELADESLALARATEDLELIGLATLHHGFVLYSMGQAASDAMLVAAARLEMLEAADAFRRVHDSASLALSLLLVSVRGSATIDEVREDLANNLEATAVAEAVGSHGVTNLLWGNRAWYELVLGDHATAEALNRRALMTKRRSGWPSWWSHGNVVVASWCAVESGEFLRAAQLEGAAEQLEEEAPEYYRRNRMVTGPLEVEIKVAMRRRMVEALGEDDFAKAYAEGRRLTYDQLYNAILRRT